VNICLFSEDEIGKPLSIKDERVQHLLKVLHKKKDDSFLAGITGGKAGNAKITEISEHALSFEFTPFDSGNASEQAKKLAEGKKLFPLKMIIGFPRPIQLKRLLRDIAALGVCEVHLTGTELGEKSYMQSTLVEKGNAYKMLLDGTVQAGSTHVPELFLHKNLNECLNALEASLDNEKISHSLRLCLDNINPKCSLNTALEEFSCVAGGNKCMENTAVIAAIGSERGWTERERALLEKMGYVRCGMGNRIMRTETAATVAGSIILNKMGFME